VDILLDGSGLRRFPGARAGGRPAHGTGCTLSAAILSLLVLGHPLPEAVARAKAYVESAVRGSLPFGSGSAVLDHGVAAGA
jgi:hydroxymethylpyrimidine kinase/phosphomethylpyrimidine kinase/thiamine-phosphate diphosphorylase